MAHERKASVLLTGVLLTGLAGLVLGLVGITAQAQPADKLEPTRKPNIVVILVDDAALMDFGAFGGEAHTPNIDRLAAAGAMLTNYHSSPLCSPSRAMLLTGMDSHRTGVSTIEEVLPPELKGKPGYTLRLEPGVLTIADRLKAAGYRTLMSGKWHLGHGPGDLPNEHGFDRSLALDASGADNWAAKPYMPYYDTAPWFEDGKPAKLPDRFYSSEMLVDRLIGYIDAGNAVQPWFGYLAFQAVHIPVQAPKEFSDKYAGRFDQGWEAIRRARWERAKTMGVVPPDAPYAEMPGTSRPWASIPEADRKKYARAIEVYSGMIEAMDHHIGRLIQHIEQRGELANTVFVITSDNGPEPSDPVHEKWMDIWMMLNGYHWNLEGMGGPGSLNFIGTEWASSISSPSSLYKFYASEGGLRVPMIMSGPGIPAGMRNAGLSFVSDVTPTLLNLAGLPLTGPPDARPITGRSLVPVFAGTASSAYGPEDTLGVEVSGNSALFRDRYKITRNMPPVGDGAWRLYDLAADPAEVNDLSKVQPDLFQNMLSAYDGYATASGVLLLPEGYQVERQVRQNAIGRQLAFHGAKLALVGAGILLAIGLLAFWLIKQRKRKTASS
ncbi:MAG TPA: arylsulfatase [Hyphomonadaceae bacterium]|nr:arylsulfatase [Hyphomonadaceae bacterium]